VNENEKFSEMKGSVIVGNWGNGMFRSNEGRAGSCGNGIVNENERFNDMNGNVIVGSFGSGMFRSKEGRAGS